MGARKGSQPGRQGLESGTEDRTGLEANQMC
jgi:hypothetical protein